MSKTPLTDAFMSDLEARLKELSVSKAALARILGTSRQTLNRCLEAKRQSKQLREALETIAACFLGAFLVFMFFGAFLASECKCPNDNTCCASGCAEDCEAGRCNCK